jgi:phenylacetate-CoA ligase
MNSAPTSLERERVEQCRWRLRPQCARMDAFDSLLTAEFLSPDEQLARQAGAIVRLVHFAARSVPYYRQLFGRLGIAVEDIRGVGDLAKLPMLTKEVVQERAAELRAEASPPGHKIWGSTQTSGTTGHPVRVLHTHVSSSMFGLLKQRELRWFRFDPSGVFAAIRPARELTRTSEAAAYFVGKTWRNDSWPLVGRYFETGPAFAFAVTNPVERQIEWLDRHRPNYLLSQSANLEHLALACADARPPDSLRGLHAIAQQLTAAMRRVVERTFGIPVQQNYGLNEIGIVASRCPEAGRFHVHTEHCVVEIVDDQGRPCGPGQFGKILVTALSNPAMPLLRYDADDLAEVTDGPCPCGRTLPSFGGIIGRYRRIAFLPPRTWDYWAALQVALADMPDSLRRHMRQYQLHQYRDGRFQFRLVTTSDDATALIEWLQHTWRAAVEPLDVPLEIKTVNQIERSPGGKFQDFTSAFVPPRDGDTDVAVARVAETEL